MTHAAFATFETIIQGGHEGFYVDDGNDADDG